MANEEKSVKTGKNTTAREEKEVNFILKIFLLIFLTKFFTILVV